MELTSACACARTSYVFDLEQLSVRNLAGRIGSHGFEYFLDRDVFPVVPAGKNGPTIEDQAWDVQSQQGHRRARDGLVARDQRDDSIEHVPARDEFHGISSQVAASPRCLLAF